jgi:hypothetical protein
MHLVAALVPIVCWYTLSAISGENSFHVCVFAQITFNKNEIIIIIIVIIIMLLLAGGFYFHSCYQPSSIAWNETETDDLD